MGKNFNTRKQIYNSIRKYLKENTYLSYDELDLDSFTNRYIVGRWFSSEDDANGYLESVIGYSNGKNISDFLVVRDSTDNTLKPYRIYPIPSNNELKRNEASKFIKKHAILSSPDSRYVTHPLYAFVEYKNIDKIKEFGVEYRFKPLKELDLDGALSRFIKMNGHTNTFYGKKLSLYNYDKFDVLDENSMQLTDIKIIKTKIEELLNRFNNILGTDYFITKTFVKETDNSIKLGLLNMLDDKRYDPNVEFKKRYDEVSFLIDRGDDEEEFLAAIEMEDINKPKMKKNN
jgi:hypothetical protein